LQSAGGGIMPLEITIIICLVCAVVVGASGILVGIIITMRHYFVRWLPDRGYIYNKKTDALEKVQKILPAKEDQ
jgi:hypothetical protein